MNSLTVLSGKDNKTVKSAAKLISSASARRQAGEFLLEGARLCADAAAAGMKIKRVFVTEKALADYKEYVDTLLLAANEGYTVTPELFLKLCDTVSPQGVAAVVEMTQSGPANINPQGMYIALENMQDPANLGAVARTAEALGISGIIISKSSCDPYSPKAQRAAMGSLLRLPVIVAEEFIPLMQKLQGEGMTICATVIKNADETLGNYKFSKRSVVMIGNEGNGLTSEAIALADKKITIKMAGRNESLNASAAAALFMWEMMKGNADGR